VGLATVGAAYAVPPSENLFPDTTRAFISAPVAKKLTEQFNKTQLGQLVKDPVMKPFVEDLRRQFDERWSNVRERLGLSLDDIRGVPSGEAAVGLIQLERDQVALALLCDVTGHKEQAAALLEKVTANLTKLGAKKQTVQVAGTSVLDFELPRAHGKDVDRPLQHSMWLQKDNLLVATDHMTIVEGILARLGGKKGGALADVPGYQAVMKRCQKDAGKDGPQARWFIQPLGYLEIMRIIRGDRVHRKGKSLIDVFKSQGFTAVQGVGGFLDFAVEKYEFVHRTAIWAPPPRKLSMTIFTFPNNKEFTPQPWVPSNVASYATIYCDLLKAFDNFGPLFDAVVGQGDDTGMWDEVVLGLKKDPNGPRLDLREELMVHLGQRVSILADYQVPITTTSERLLIAIEVKDEKAVAAALHKMFKNDKEMRQREFEKRIIWEGVPEEKSEVPVVTLDLPGLQPEERGKAPTPQGRQNAPFPNAALTAANGHLFIASHYDFLIKVLKQNNPRDSLARAIEYQMVQKTLDKFGVPAKSVRTFGRTDEQARPTYELIRQGRMPESETMLGRVLNTLFGAGKKGVMRKQEIDGKSMPDYEFVRRFLGPAGMQVVTEDPDGWFLKGVLLTK
jgi:hypothetical protein